MISKYAGKCGTCNKPYKVGDDIYWTQKEGAHCWPCRDNPQPTPECYRIADALGFLPHESARAFDWSQRRTHDDVLSLLRNPDRGSARREEPEACDNQPTLFGMPK